jgi:hypothetical protein
MTMLGEQDNQEQNSIDALAKADGHNTWETRARNLTRHCAHTTVKDQPKLIS